tara:strand:+ start:8439 stop:8603 length:165 start_codon:yes stop_codon:yes gene_type:complete
MRRKNAVDLVLGGKMRITWCKTVKCAASFDVRFATFEREGKPFLCEDVPLGLIL